MNRKMRRAAERKAIDKEAARVRSEIEKNEQRLFSEAERMVGMNYHLLWMLVLHDKFGFGHDRLLRCFKEVEQLAIAKVDGYLDFEDIKETLWQECKLNFRRVSDGGKK